MSVVSGAAAGRWAIAAVVTVVVAATPAAYARLPTAESSLRPAQLLAQARHSTRVAHSGLAESRGNLGLPDLPRLGDVAALLGGTTRTRVWWRSPTALAGRPDHRHRGVRRYAVADGVQTWDFETGRIERAVGASPVRLPRVDDLLPPQAARRLLAGVTARDRSWHCPRTGWQAVRPTACGSSRPTGEHRRPARRVRRRRTGLPLSLVVVPRGSTVPALRTAFVDVVVRQAAGRRPACPGGPAVRHGSGPPAPRTWRGGRPVRAVRAARRSSAGLPRTADLVGSFGGTATYGRGLARFVVLPLPSRLGGPALDAATRGGATPLELGTGGAAVLVATPLLDAVVARTSPTRRRRRPAAGPVVPGRRHRRRADPAPGRARPGCRPTGVPVTGTAAAGTPVIRTEALTKRFGRVLAVDGVSLEVAEGDRYGFLGPNGSGKTTTVRILLGLVFATSGYGRGARPPGARHARASLTDVGAMIEGPAAYGHLSARANLSLIDAAGPGGSRRTRRTRVAGASSRSASTPSAAGRCGPTPSA